MRSHIIFFSSLSMRVHLYLSVDIGARREVSKEAKDGRRLPALWAIRTCLKNKNVNITNRCERDDLLTY
jgi:hypothetical protein